MDKNKINLDSLTLGSDPEVFLFSEGENRHVPGIGLVGGTKKKPIKITDEGHAIQEDGVAAEFNIPPCKTKEEYKKHINFVLDYISDTIAKPNGLILSKKATVEFTSEQLKHRQAQEIGCSSSIDPYALMMTSPEAYTNNLRSVGGHIHIGYEGHSEQYSLELSKIMDLFLGVLSVLLDSDTQRRQKYGKAGEMRFTKFGFEYRTLSNFWIFDPKLIEWAFDSVIKGFEFFNMGGIITNPEQIRECINNCDKKLALEILDDYNIELPKIESLTDYFNSLEDNHEVAAS